VVVKVDGVEYKNNETNSSQLISVTRNADVTVTCPFITKKLSYYYFAACKASV